MTVRFCMIWAALWDRHVSIGRSSRDLVLSAPLTVTSTVEVPRTFTIHSTMGEILADEKGKEVFGPLLKNAISELGVDDPVASTLFSDRGQSILNALPASGLTLFSGGRLTREILQNLLERLK